MRRCPVCQSSYDGQPERCPLDGAALDRGGDRTGKTIRGWLVRAMIAETALARVYLVERDGQEGVLKLYRRSLPLAYERASSEARAQRRVVHPRLALLLEDGLTDEGDLYLVSERLPGPTLRDLLDRSPAGLGWRAATAVAAQLAEGLEAIHGESLVHRDVKPENLILVRTAPPDLRILDLGHALLLDSERLTSRGLAWGSAPYMSPEQAAAQPIDARSDLYALGVVFYEMLTGRRPFEARAAVDVMQMHMWASPVPPVELADIPELVSEMCLWLLKKAPGDRPCSARVARAALLGLVQDQRGRSRGAGKDGEDVENG
jgi:serine/threonine-protein kinase